MAGLLVNSLDKCLKDSLLPLVPDAGTPHRATTTTVRAAQVAARALVTATMAWMLPRPLADARASLQPAAPRPTVTAAEAWSVPTKDAIIVFGSLATGYRLERFTSKTKTDGGVYDSLSTTKRHDIKRFEELRLSDTITMT